MMEYHISELMWNKIFDFLKNCVRIYAYNAHEMRIFIEAIWYISRSGCQWRLLPPGYGKWNSIYKRFKRWVNKGILQKLFEHFQIDSDTEFVMIDATIVRAQACAAGYKKNSQDQEALGRSRCGFSTKIHALVDALGNPLHFILTPGQRNEITQAESLIQNVHNTIVIADKGYDSNAFIQKLVDKDCGTNTFIINHEKIGWLPETKEKIIDMTLNGSGIRDISRFLGISIGTVMSEIKKKKTYCNQ